MCKSALNTVWSSYLPMVGDPKRQVLSRSVGSFAKTSLSSGTCKTTYRFEHRRPSRPENRVVVPAAHTLLLELVLV
ncbi:hypothetical protein Hanom_Chr15g01380471 [Helianthus anomalus]